MRYVVTFVVIATFVVVGITAHRAWKVPRLSSADVDAVNHARDRSAEAAWRAETVPRARDYLAAIDACHGSVRGSPAAIPGLTVGSVDARVADEVTARAHRPFIGVTMNHQTVCELLATFYNPWIPIDSIPSPREIDSAHCQPVIDLFTTAWGPPDHVTASRPPWPPVRSWTGPTYRTRVELYRGGACLVMFERVDAAECPL